MALWSAEIKELEKLYESFKGQLPDLEKELERLIKADDENMILLYSRRCLEVIITDLCECELKRPRKTEPLQGIIDKLLKEEKVPSHIIASMHGLNELSTFGAHPKDFDPKQVRTTLINLETIIEWYLKRSKSGSTVAIKPGKEISQKTTGSEDVKKKIRITNKRLAAAISGFIILIAIVAGILFLTGIISGNRQNKNLVKSIAVLPFEVWNSDEEFQYLGNAIANEINTQLCIVKKFHVISWTSSSRYKGPEKPPIPRIGKELGANLIIEGSIERQSDDISIQVQVINAQKDDHFWAQEFRDKWVNIIGLRADIAKKVADVLNTSLTPEEKQRIEKIPTTNITAYDFYQRGREELTNYSFNNVNREALKNAKKYFGKALEYDSTYALAYAGMALTIEYQNVFLPNDQNYINPLLDSIVLLTDRALLYDSQIAEAYFARALYFWQTGKSERSLQEFDKALKFNPNFWEAYFWEALAYSNNYKILDYVKVIEYLSKAVSLNPGKERPDLIRQLGSAYSNAGFHDKAVYFYQEAFKLDYDSISFFNSLALEEFNLQNFEKQEEYIRRALVLDPDNVNIKKELGEALMHQGKYKESLKYFEDYFEWVNKTGSILEQLHHRIGFVYWQNGDTMKANHYFKVQENNCKKSIEMNLAYASTGLGAFYDLAGIYAFMGEKGKAYQNLNKLKQFKAFPLWWLTLIKKDQLFDGIRTEPEFQEIVSHLESKYQAEHERVKKWLEEQGML